MNSWRKNMTNYETDFLAYQLLTLYKGKKVLISWSSRFSATLPADPTAASTLKI